MWSRATRLATLGQRQPAGKPAPSLRARRATSSPARAGSGRSVCDHDDRPRRPDPHDQFPGGRCSRRHGGLGRFRLRVGLRSGRDAPGGPPWSVRGGILDGAGGLQRRYRGDHRGSHPRRAGDAGHAGRHRGPLSDGLFDPIVTAAEDPDSDRLGDRSPPDSRVRHAHRVRHAGPGSGSSPRERRARRRPGHPLRDLRDHPAGHGNPAPLGADHRSGRRFRRRVATRSR